MSTRTTALAPRLAKDTATAFPSPRAPPVTNATPGVRSLDSLVFDYIQSAMFAKCVEGVFNRTILELFRAIPFLVRVDDSIYPICRLRNKEAGWEQTTIKRKMGLVLM